jgi:hypothetical protein
MAEQSKSLEKAIETVKRRGREQNPGAVSLKTVF